MKSEWHVLKKEKGRKKEKDFGFFKMFEGKWWVFSIFYNTWGNMWGDYDKKRKKKKKKGLGLKHKVWVREETLDPRGKRGLSLLWQ